MLVFLDIDGVRVPIKEWMQPEIMEDGFPAFSPKAVDAIRKVLSKNANALTEELVP